MLKVGDKFSAREDGSNYRVAFDYKCGDLFEVIHIHIYSDECTLKHLKSGVEFKENQFRLGTNFKQYIENADERFVIENLNQVDSMTLDAIKSLVEESINPKTLEQRVEALEEALIAQKEYLENKIGTMRYKAHKNGYHI